MHKKATKPTPSHVSIYAMHVKHKKQCIQHKEPYTLVIHHRPTVQASHIYSEPASFQLGRTILDCNATHLHEEPSNTPVKYGIVLAEATSKLSQKSLHKPLDDKAAISGLSPYISQKPEEGLFPTKPCASRALPCGALAGVLVALLLVTQHHSHLHCMCSSSTEG